MEDCCILGLIDRNIPYEDGAKAVIEKIEKMNTNLKIKSNLTCIKENDIPKLAKIAAKEANPLYPVPVLYSAKNLEKVYHILKIKA
jgi:alcohol dehydrogenase class IV